MYFKSDIHRNRFLVLKKKAGQGNDCEYAAAIYVLSAMGKPVEKYVQPGDINFSRMFRETHVWSSSERALTRLAATLHNAAVWPIAIYDVFYSLDEENTRVALQALEIRYLMR